MTKTLRAAVPALLLMLPLSACRDQPVAALPSGGAATGRIASVPVYYPIDLGTLGGDFGRAHGINSAGHVVGQTAPRGALSFRGFVWSPAGRMQDLWPAFSAEDINDAGTIAGFSGSHAMVRSTSGTWKDLGLLPRASYSSASAINNLGEVVGSSGRSRSFLYRSGVMLELGTASANDINDSTHIVGQGAGGAYILRYPGDPHRIVGGWNAHASGINNRGQVVGSDGTDAFVWDSAGGLQLLPGGGRWAMDINDSGVIVGFSPGRSSFLPTVWTPDGAGGYIRTLLGDAEGRALAINDAGQVVGYAAAGSYVRAMMWAPGPPLPPGAPTALRARASSPGRIDLDWVNPSGPGFELQVRRSTRQPDGRYSPSEAIAVLSGGTASHPDSGVAPGGLYRYQVRACNAFGCAGSAFVPAGVPLVPAAPAGLAATIAGPRRIHLSWTDVSMNEREFRVRRSTRAGDGTYPPYEPLGSLRAGTTGYADTTAVPGGVYRYQVQACNVSGCGSGSPVVATAPLPPDPPTGVTARRAAGGVEVRWTDASTTETLFRVRRSLRRADGTFGAYAPLADLPAGSVQYQDDSAAAGGTYRYRVEACRTVACAGATSGPVTMP